MIHNHKTKFADDFLRKNMINDVNFNKLNISSYEKLKNGESNLKFIFDKIIK